MLRYVIYDSAGQSVLLSKEIDAIRNYINLQKFRVGNESSIRFDIDGEPVNYSIPPMLLLPLVENGFKHGIKGDVGETYLFINLKIRETKLEFRVENNKGSGPMENDNNKGIGLENIRSRLELVFPNDYSMQIRDEEKMFVVYLSFPHTQVPEDLK
jgi:LytS/YehU family sensor histidine kinase